MLSTCMSKTLNCMLSTGSTQEDSGKSGYDYNNVDWDVKHQHKQIQISFIEA